MCNNVTGLFDCANDIYIDVRKFTDFGSITSTTLPAPTKEENGKTEFDSTKLSYETGGPGDIVVVRLFYQLPIYMQLWNPESGESGRATSVSWSRRPPSAMNRIMPRLLLLLKQRQLPSLVSHRI